MPDVIRFHLDESMPNAVANGLRKRDRDVTTSKDAGLLSADDEDHVAFALSESRVFITRDDDFLVLASQGVQHAGIAYWTEKRSLGQLIKDLDSLCFDQTPEEMQGRVVYL